MNVLWPFLLSFIWAIYWYFSFFHIQTVEGAESNIFTWKLRAGQLFLKMLGFKLGHLHVYLDIFESETFPIRIQKFPRPHVSGYFWICKFFLACVAWRFWWGAQRRQGKGSETARRFWVVLIIRNKSTTQNLKRQQSGFQMALEAKRQ